MPAGHLLLVSEALFCLGLYGVLARRNMVAILMSIELILNAANLNFVAFAQSPAAADPLEGQVVVIFVMGVAACEAVVGLALIVAIVRFVRTANADEIGLMRG